MLIIINNLKFKLSVCQYVKNTVEVGARVSLFKQLQNRWLDLGYQARPGRLRIGQEMLFEKQQECLSGSKANEHKMQERHQVDRKWKVDFGPSSASIHHEILWVYDRLEKCIFYHGADKGWRFVHLS